MGSKPGRNQPCPCGSGRKYKKCCGIKDDAQRRSVIRHTANARVRAMQQRVSPGDRLDGREMAYQLMVLNKVIADRGLSRDELAELTGHDRSLIDQCRRRLESAGT